MSHGSFGSEHCACLQAVVSGIGRHLGINIQWQVRWREDGAFQESLRGRELSFEWGYDGGSANTWELDSSGVARALVSTLALHHRPMYTDRPRFGLSLAHCDRQELSGTLVGLCCRKRTITKPS